MTFVTIFESWGHNSLRWLRSINFDLVGRWDMTWFFSPFFEAKSCYNLWGNLGDQMCIQESSTLLLACEDLICTTLAWAEAPSFYQGALLGYLFQKLVRYIAAFRQFPHKSNNFQSFFCNEDCAACGGLSLMCCKHLWVRGGAFWHREL